MEFKIKIINIKQCIIVYKGILYYFIFKFYNFGGWSRQIRYYYYFFLKTRESGFKEINLFNIVYKELNWF